MLIGFVENAYFRQDLNNESIIAHCTREGMELQEAYWRHRDESIKTNEGGIGN